MGTFSEWSYTATITVWEPTLDEYGQPSAWTRSTYSASFRAGGNLSNDDAGEQFYPQTTIWLAATDADAPAVGSKVVTELSTATSPPDSAETIRSVTKHDPSLFDEGTPDRVVLTG